MNQIDTERTTQALKDELKMQGLILSANYQMHKVAKAVIEEYKHTNEYSLLVQQFDLTVNLLGYLITRLPPSEQTAARTALESIHTTKS
jgi:hypothetical protein